MLTFVSIGSSFFFFFQKLKDSSDFPKPASMQQSALKKTLQTAGNKMTHVCTFYQKSIFAMNGLYRESAKIIIIPSPPTPFFFSNNNVRKKTCKRIRRQFCTYDRPRRPPTLRVSPGN